MTRSTSLLNIAHRGASAYAPENTFAAFDLALAQGAEHVELDVHPTRDGEVAVIHDATVDRTTDGSGPVEGRTLAELQALDAGSWFATRYAGESVPSLDEVLKRYRGRLHVHIEIKSEAIGLAEQCADLVQSSRMTHGVTMTSFHVPHLEAIRRSAPGLPLALLTRALDASVVETALELGAVAVSPHSASVTPEWVRTLHRAGLHVRAWKVADEADMLRLIKIGVDGLTLDFPDRLTAHLLAPTS